MSNIVISSVNKSFGEKKVFSDLSLEFKEGRITCIKGPSGRGKTTLFNLISGIYTPDSGSISGVPEKIGCVFQDNRLSDNFSAVSNIKAVTGKNMSRKEIVSVLEELGLGSDLSKPVSEFSGGMKRRVAIARAICYNADLLLLDEPFKGLDEKLKETVADYIKRNTAGKTVICITHDDDDLKLLDAELIELN